MSQNGFSDVTHVHKDIYSIKLSLLVFADDLDADFINPRHVARSHQPHAEGMDQLSMEKLSESIRRDGLLSNPIVQGEINDGTPFTINSGERRIRCIKKLFKENVPCKDRATGKMVPAQELYEYIDCKVISNKLALEERFRIAFQTNDSACDIGEGANVALVKRFKDQGWSEEQIKEATGKSQTWIRDTLALCDLDDECYSAVVNGDINRTVALKLAGEPDKIKRVATLNRTITIASGHLDQLNQEEARRLEAAQEQLELAEAAVEDAKVGGSKGRRKVAEKKLKDAEKSVERRHAKVTLLKSKRPRATGKHFTRALIQDADGQNVGILTPSKIRKFWRASLRAEAEKGHRDARFLMFVLDEGMFKNDRDILALMERFHEQEKK
jgi:hypothetical protein